MILPSGCTESMVLASIEKAVNMLAPSFVFGYLTVDDLKQQGTLYALQALSKGKYDPTRPLDNFVYSHIKNRLINYRRDNYRRNDPPCRDCHAAAMGGGEATFCDRYAAWRERNLRKVNVMRPLDLDYISDEGEPNTRVAATAEDNAKEAELLSRIDEMLDVSLRADYLRLRAGQALPKTRREAVEAAVREILSDE